MGIRVKLTLDPRRAQKPSAFMQFLYRARRRLATVAVCLLVVGLGWHVIFGANGMVVYEQKRVEYRKLQQEIEQLQQENERYTQQIKALKSDPKAIEREAREQLRYTRPGAVVYVMPADNRAAISTSTAKK